MGLTTVNYTPALPSRATENEKIDFLYGVLKKLWQLHIDDYKEIAALKVLLNSDYTTKRIVELINSANTHTGEMPDRKGENKDHDSRYLVKNSAVVAKSVLLTLNGKSVVEMTIDGTDMVLRYDKNLGVGSPDWTGEILRFPMA